MADPAYAVLEIRRNDVGEGYVVILDSKALDVRAWEIYPTYPQMMMRTQEFLQATFEADGQVA